MSKIPNREIAPIVSKTMEQIKRLIGAKLTTIEIDRLEEIITSSSIELSRKNFKASGKIITKRGYDDED